MSLNINFWLSLIIIPVLVFINGLLSGLTLGLLSLDETKLEVLLKSGTPKQQKAAARIKPLRKNPHLLLATLLLGNTLINEALPILLHNLINNEWISVAISVALVLTFAELIPQALCTHYGLFIGSTFAWFVYILRFFFFPIAYPLGKLLDVFLGNTNGALYKKSELKEFVTLHGIGHGGELNADEVKIVQGTLSLQGKTVEQIMTKLQYVFMVKMDEIVDLQLLEKISQSGHSRIPVYDESQDKISGIILVKDLLLIDRNATKLVKDLPLLRAKKMLPQTNLLDAINYFQEGASHLSVVADEAGHTLGICTLEDCIEELLMEEVWDESDVYTDNTHSRPVPRPRRERRQFVQIQTS